MAFKGTSRPHRPQIADEMSSCVRRSQRANRSPSAPPTTLACSGRVPLSPTYCPISLSYPSFRPEELPTREERHRAGDGRFEMTRPTTLCSKSCRRRVFRRSPDEVSSFSARARRCAASTSIVGSRRLSQAHYYRRPRHLVVQAGASNHLSIVKRGRGAVWQLRLAVRGCRRPEPRSSCPALPHRDARHLEQVHVALAMQELPQRDPRALQPADILQRARRCTVSGCPRSVREIRVLVLFHLTRFTLTIRHKPECSALACTDAAYFPRLMPWW